ncbi:PH domain-containing protein [Georgenia satyanarayanai]|uniref:PH domain-containing protein n=1 Tax=Georgenia satyanarayanai TaxID=860221 RepID=UPI00203DF578|nr:PH domain-containing protein [Georgenia satyanarayanai]MCM3659977.1 PH domain-containing protein [Georgenia satyanarayanai]
MHHQELRRRTYRWQEISEVCSTAKWGESFVELVGHDGEAVRLPRSTERLDVLRRWYAAASGRPRP